MYLDKYNAYYRSLIVGVDTKVPLANGSMVTAINFDNAATTPPFVSVLNEVIEFAPWYSSVHRGTGYKSQVSSNLFEKARLAILNFVNADPGSYTVVFVKNTTEALNKLSNRLCDKQKKCVVLSTCMEHHSNDLPWRNKYTVDYVKVLEDGSLSIRDLEDKLIKYNGDVKLVTVTGASNVTGCKNPIYEIAALAHKYNAKICVDGAQLVPHSPVSMRSQNPLKNIDYLAFSAHKMYAPFGIGVLVSPKEIFNNGEPDYSGGGTVKIVTHDYIKWDDPPHKEEAGSPNIIGIAALLASIDTLNSLGMKNIERYEQDLAGYAIEKLREIPDIVIYGDSIDIKDKVGIIPFNIEGVRHDIVASALSREAGIAVRNGCFCAQPYIQRLLNINPDKIKDIIDDPNAFRPGMVRVSFGLYNNCQEVDILVDILKWMVQYKDVYIKKYSKS